MSDSSNGENQTDEEFYILRLFVSGTSPNSVRAINNLKIICENHLKGRHELEIIDIHQQPLLVRNEDVTAVPMLIKKSPLPKRRLVGDMSEKDKVLKGLGLV
ncbi:circadian clock KaiB family protein [Daejeonella lutea]|uniref:Circadian clock protein KaiB n=1 Tax=Daejeonella lutea TaxID=572036 RepID=A0A1T5DWS4_9SPHI|nr:circadian clock KaiB family protein [Daejeonella lutea]SKB76127.1 circadian clock protein KaiB [Daejeonella lutea]